MRRAIPVAILAMAPACSKADPATAAPIARSSERAMPDAAPATAAAEIALAELRVLEPKRSYRVAGTPIELVLEGSGYPLVSEASDGHRRHQVAATFRARVPGDERAFRLLGPQFFTFHGLRIDYRVTGPLSHTEPLEIGVTVSLEADAGLSEAGAW